MPPVYLSTIFSACFQVHCKADSAANFADAWTSNEEADATYVTAKPGGIAHDFVTLPHTPLV